MLTRRTLLAASAAGAPLVGAAALALDADADAAPRGTGGTVTRAESAERRLRHGAVVSSFVSAPDLFNGDVGDLSTLARWDGGVNSINDSWRQAIGQVVDALARHRPDAVLVAGDVVEGRWNLDTQGRELFGPVSPYTDPLSLQQCRQAITTAGGVYYGHYRRLFADRGLRLLPALGDHELLDDRTGAPVNDRWSPTGYAIRRGRFAEPDNRYHLVPHAKSVWASHFTRPGGTPLFASRPVRTQSEWTAYAVGLGSHLTVITVDVFTRTPLGVRMGVFGGQLEWLRRTIRQAKRLDRVVVVQGHVPIMTPVRSLASGGLRVPEGRDSDLYRTLAAEGVDFYLCGEVHDTSVRQHRAGAPVQVSHGSIFRLAFNYLHGQVHADGTTVLDYYEMNLDRASADRGLWSTEESKWQRSLLQYGEPVLRGTLVARRGRVQARTGKLAPYDAATDRLAYAGNLHPGPLVSTEPTDGPTSQPTAAPTSAPR